MLVLHTFKFMETKTPQETANVLLEEEFNDRNEEKVKNEALKLKLVVLPTGKPHTSFSEVSCWVNCSYAHKKAHVEHIDLGVATPFLSFGKVQHKCCENLLKHGDPCVDAALRRLERDWNEHPEFEKMFPLADAKRAIIEVTPELKPFLDATFPGWEWVSSEELLYEQVEGTEHAFKGYIDLVIKVPRGKRYVYWILDFKTAKFTWLREKRDNKVLQSQLVYYKHFFSKKHKVDMKDIRCGFVLLKRTAKAGQRVELVAVSVGDVTLGRAIKVLKNMLSSVKRGVALKNKNEKSCHYCMFKGTEHCP